MKTSGSVELSGVDLGTMVQENGLPLEAWPDSMQNWEATRVSGGVPARAGQVDHGRGSSGVMENILASLPAPVREFLTEPAPPSALAMVGVTAAGAVGSHFAPRAVPQVTPLMRAALGAAVVAGGHYVAREWWVKSIGYGVLAEGLFEAAYLAYRRRQGEAIPPGASATNLPDPMVQGAGLGTPRTLTEAQFLSAVENNEVDLDRVPASGTTLDNSMSLESTVVMPDGARLSIPQYVARFGDRVRAAKARGDERRRAARAAAQGGTPQPEAEYLQWIAEYCVMGRGEAQARRLGVNPNAMRDSVMRTSRPIQIEDGTLVEVASYNRRFQDRVMRAMANCEAMVRSALSEQGTGGGAGAGGGTGAGAGGGGTPLRDMARTVAPGPIFTIEEQLPATTLRETIEPLPQMIPSVPPVILSNVSLNPSIAGAKSRFAPR